MLKTDMLRTMGRLLARQARERAAREDAPANEVIELTGLLTPWKEGPWAAGDVTAYRGCPYRVAQAHDSTGSPEWNPADTPALFAPFHATDRAHALAYKAPTGAHDAYCAGEWMVFTDGRAYRCLQDATVWGPDVLPGAWEAEAP